MIVKKVRKGLSGLFLSAILSTSTQAFSQGYNDCTVEKVKNNLKYEDIYSKFDSILKEEKKFVISKKLFSLAAFACAMYYLNCCSNTYKPFDDMGQKVYNLFNSIRMGNVLSEEEKTICREFGRYLHTRFMDAGIIACSLSERYKVALQSAIENVVSKVDTFRQELQTGRQGINHDAFIKLCDVVGKDRENEDLIAFIIDCTQILDTMFIIPDGEAIYNFLSSNRRSGSFDRMNYITDPFDPLKIAGLRNFQ